MELQQYTKGKKGTVINYFIPDDDPTNLIRMENKELSSSSSRESTPVNTSNLKSTVLKRLDTLVAGNTEKKIEKKRKVNPHGEIVTSDEVFEVVCEKEENKKQKTNVELFAMWTHKRNSNERKTVEKEMDEDIDETIDILEDDSDSSNESNDYRDSENERTSLPTSFKFPPPTENESYAYLKFVWSEFNPQVQEKDVQGCYFGLIYFSYGKRKKGWPFVGKVLRRYRSGKDSAIQYLEMECRKYTSKEPAVLEKNPSHFDREIYIIPAWDVVAGSLKVTSEVEASTTSIRKLTSSKVLVPGTPNSLKHSLI